jgi:hypothetical protein
MNYTRRKMNSFKKIALGLVAAMTLGTIVATPASANTVSVAVTTKAVAADTGSAIAPLTVNVPFDNVISDTATATSEVLTLTATVPSGTPVTFATTGNAKLLTTLTPAPTSASGVTSLTVTPAATEAVAYLFTTSTTASAVTVSVLGASTTLYVKGIAGPAYNIALSVPASGNIGGSVTATATVTDIFGNPKAATPVFTAINGTVGSVTQDAIVTNKYTAPVTMPLVAGTVAVGASLPTTTPALADVPTLVLPVKTAAAMIAATDLAGSLTAANAALAAEKAARDADKAAAATALAAAVKAEQDKAAAAALAAAADLVKANAEIAKLKADAVTAKAAADKALADATAAAKAELDALKAENAKAIADMKAAFNSLAKKWNAKNPKAKVTLVK